MPTENHLVLVVEDDDATRQELEEILSSLNYTSVSCDNKRDALTHIGAKTFCMALLDLEIKAEPSAIKGHTEHGKSLLRDIRRIYPGHSGSAFCFPILIISGYAREWPEAKEVMKDGASDFIRKPLTGEVSVSGTIRDLLQRSGRASHRECVAAPAPSAPLVSDMCLSIPGDRVGQRTRVLLGSKDVCLIDSSLRVLLHLIAGRLEGRPVHKSDLGAKDTQGFKGISVLRDAMKSAFPLGVDEIVNNDHHGNYELVEAVSVGDIAVQHLIDIGEHRIAVLAQRIAALMSAESDGKL